MELPVRRLVRHAPAKINLALHVAGRRADGYHLLESLVVFSRIGDRVTISAADEDRFSVTGPFAGLVPAGTSNLVLRARDRLRAAFPAMTETPVAIELEKVLPVASGIGGGSSDAAQTLHALAEICRIADHAALVGIGRELGADIPMCLAARPLIARGIGEVLEPVKRFPALPLVLVNPGVAVPTAEVFRALAFRDNPGLPPLPAELDFPSVCGWLAAARNDLQPSAIAIAPAIAATLQALKESGAAFARMSGSGATCFGLFETRDSARGAAEKIGAAHPGWWAVATQTMRAEENCDARS
jgi:4-diphosphocytidyl-2-C-methyl-D-erythritol kinase